MDTFKTISSLFFSQNLFRTPMIRNDQITIFWLCFKNVLHWKYNWIHWFAKDNSEVVNKQLELHLFVIIKSSQ